MPRIFLGALPQAYNSFLIYAKSALVEQTTPEIHQIFDAKARCAVFIPRACRQRSLSMLQVQANVVNPLLVDEDLDLDEIGG